MLEEVQLAGAKVFRKISNKKNNKRRNFSNGENCALLSYYTPRVVVIPYRLFGTTYLSHFQIVEKVILEDETENLPRNVGKELPLLSAL